MTPFSRITPPYPITVWDDLGIWRIASRDHLLKLIDDADENLEYSNWHVSMGTYEYMIDADGGFREVRGRVDTPTHYLAWMADKFDIENLHAEDANGNEIDIELWDVVLGPLVC